MTKSVPPSTKERAFNCPHCGAYTTQFWHDLSAERVKKDPGVPFVPDQQMKDEIRKQSELKAETRERLVARIEEMLSGEIYLHGRETSKSVYIEVTNLFLSECYACDKVAVWVHDRLVYPPTRSGAAPNTDLPPDILADYEEARSILDLSPRGAAALLRLCIQKLCAFLGEKGRNIDADIASLVAKGLNPLMQKSLDVVRVVGNESVHPGVMDLKDDRDTATTLFGLVNAIADQMITHPKTVNEMYEKIPPERRAAIAARDAKTDKN